MCLVDGFPGLLISLWSIYGRGKTGTRAPEGTRHSGLRAAVVPMLPEVTVFFFLSSLLSIFRFLFLFFSLFLNKGGVGTQMCEKEQLFSISSLERL